MTFPFYAAWELYLMNKSFEDEILAEFCKIPDEVFFNDKVIKEEETK